MKQLSYGMVGGGSGAFIGDVHRKAISMDALATLKAGVFSSDPEKSRKDGMKLGLSEDRLYSDYREMALQEGKREDGINFVVVVTPNNTHYEVCKVFLEQKIHVVCDKPLTFTVEEALKLKALATKHDLLFAVTYTYTGYPAVKQMRAMIQSGVLGKIRFVNAEYPQEWLGKPASEPLPWRLKPEYSGITNSLGDIGTHIENLVATVTALQIRRVSARLDTLVDDGRVLDDNASVMVEYEGGAKGLYWASQIAFGHDNGLRIRIFGEKGGLEWTQEDPDHIRYTPADGPKQILSRGRDAFAAEAQQFSRIPAGHPEGVFEAFANIYRAFITALSKKLAGESPEVADLDFPSIDAGIAGVRFIIHCVQSSQNDSAWVSIE